MPPTAEELKANIEKTTRYFDRLKKANDPIAARHWDERQDLKDFLRDYMFEP